MVNKECQRNKGRTKLLYVIGLAFVIGLVLPVLVAMIVPGEDEKAGTGKQVSPVATDALPSLQERMQGITVSVDNAGRGYVAYLLEEERYTTDYIPGGKWAVDAADVRALLRIGYGAEAMGTYSAVGGGSLGRNATAYRRFALIELVDMRTGEVVLSQKVYGGNPPMLVSNLDSATGEVADGYGSKPEEKDIKDACKAMINEFEANK